MMFEAAAYGIAAIAKHQAAYQAALDAQARAKQQSDNAARASGRLIDGECIEITPEPERRLLP